MTQPERRRQPSARAPSPLRLATDSGTYKVLLPIILSAGLGWLNNSIDKQTAHIASMEQSIQKVQRDQELDKTNLVNRVEKIEKFIPDKVQERNEQMAAMNRQIADLAKSVTDLKESVTMLTYRFDSDHRKK